MAVSTRGGEQGDCPDTDMLEEENTWPASPDCCVRCGQDKDSSAKDSLTSTSIPHFQGATFLFAYGINCASECQMVLGETQQELADYFRAYRTAPWSGAGLYAARRQELITGAVRRAAGSRYCRPTRVMPGTGGTGSR